MKKTGFTIIELIFVIVILSIISTVIFTPKELDSLKGAVVKAKQEAIADLEDDERGKPNGTFKAKYFTLEEDYTKLRGAYSKKKDKVADLELQVKLLEEKLEAVQLTEVVEDITTEAVTVEPVHKSQFSYESDYQ